VQLTDLVVSPQPEGMVQVLKRTFGFDVPTCPCWAEVKLLALVMDPTSVARYLRGIGEPTDVPKRTPALLSAHASLAADRERENAW